MDPSTTLTAQQTIQAILSPALMISATGLLLLGLNNRYSSQVNRIRLLNDEKRRAIRAQESRNEIDYLETVRLESVVRQISSLFHRSNLLRRSIFFHYIGILLYILTSLIIGLHVIYTGAVIESLPLVIFFIGLSSSMAGVVFAIMEVFAAYKVLQLEVRAE